MGAGSFLCSTVAVLAMPRQKNTRPTSIYWLYDSRTGIPFYCGKTVESVSERLTNHKREAIKKPHRALSKKLIELDKYVTHKIMELIAPADDWAARERYWITVLRRLYPSCLNISAGGAGVPGLIHTTQTREKFRAARTGKALSPSTRAKLSAALKGKTVSIETRAKLRVANTGKRLSAEHCAQMSATRKGIPLSEEHRSKMRVSAYIGWTKRRKRLEMQPSSDA